MLSYRLFDFLYTYASDESLNDFNAWCIGEKGVERERQGDWIFSSFIASGQNDISIIYCIPGDHVSFMSFREKK